MKFIYEMPVFDGGTKVWKILNLTTGSIYSKDYKTEQLASDAIEHGQNRANATVCRIDLRELSRENRSLAEIGAEYFGK